MTVAAVTAININRGLVLLDSGAVVKINTMMDSDGNETNDPAECFCAIVQLPCGKWACLDLRDFENSASH